MAEKIAGIIIPEGTVALASLEEARRRAPRLMVNHACRVFIFGAIMAAQRGLKMDVEMLYVSAMFHQIGLLGSYSTSVERFEVDGANAAMRFLKNFPVKPNKYRQVWDAIALHSTPGIGRWKSPLAAALRLGVEVDLLGMHFRVIHLDERTQAVRAFPREASFSSLMLEALGNGLMHRPDTVTGTDYADILERVDPTYRRTNFCGKILGSEWCDE